MALLAIYAIHLWFIMDLLAIAVGSFIGAAAGNYVGYKLAEWWFS